MTSDPTLFEILELSTQLLILGSLYLIFAVAVVVFTELYGRRQSRRLRW